MDAYRFTARCIHWGIILLVTYLTLVLWLVFWAIQQGYAADETATWDGTTGSWTDAEKWDTTAFPNNNGTTYDAILGGGTVTLDQDITIDGYTQSGGTLTDAATFTLTVSGLTTWTGGWMTGTGNTQADRRCQRR